MSTLHTAHEGQWLSIGQQQALDLSSVIQIGTPLESLFTGVLGIQARPVVIEVVGWLIYAVPMLLVVLWPRGRRRRPVSRPAGAQLDAAHS